MIPQVQPLQTARLTLIPSTASLAQAELGPQVTFSKLLKATIPTNWPPENMTDALPWFVKQLQEHPELAGWFSWYFVLRKELMTLIGTGGFKGEPQADGTLEIGYSVLPPYQGCGYATEAVVELLSWAFKHDGVSRILAESAPNNKSSVRVLEKLKFDPIGQGSEPGTIRFELLQKNFQKMGQSP
jgi:ribosomal-protein-alanine N-acetyltransferase